jgi:cyclophilin family peptidyl-prolyl cis-trans isomerase
VPVNREAGRPDGQPVPFLAVPNKRTRNRQLARQASQRQMEKRRRDARRRNATIAVALLIALGGGIFAFLAFAGGDETDVVGASGATGGTAPTGPTTPTGPTATGPSGPSGATGREGRPGKVTGTVEPTPGPETVACGGRVPPGASEPKPQFNAPKEVLEEGTTYTATMSTSCGDIVVELLADRAPQTVNSFVFLAGEGYFDGQRFHRIDTSIDVIQGGDPTGTGTGGPGYSIPDELTGQETYTTGVLAMANAGPNTGGSQFFVIFGENGLNLDSNPNYTIFGQITEGLDVAQTIGALDIQDPSGGIGGQQPAEAVYLESVTIDTE